jgi:hypothetical protein
MHKRLMNYEKIMHWKDEILFGWSYKMQFELQEFKRRKSDKKKEIWMQWNQKDAD